MGIYLSAPDTRKHSIHSEGKSNRVLYGASSMQGWRLNMEDDHITTEKLPNDPKMSLFAVFDGHGGSEVAKYCGKYFERELLKNPSYKNGNYEVALKETFMMMDVLLTSSEGQQELRQLKTDQDGSDSFAGCTANVCLITADTVYCANAGDSRTILYSNKKVVSLSTDHKPDNEEEKQRISKAGGFIIEGRVNGNLNLSRAIGDLEYKKNPSLKPSEQLISAYPEVVARKIQKDDHFLVMGCDGIWEIMTQEEICHIVANKCPPVLNEKSLVKSCEEILDKGLAPDTSVGTGCDNMSVIVISLVHPGQGN